MSEDKQSSLVKSEIKLTSVPSLQQLTLVKLATELWSRSDVRNLFSDFLELMHESKWQELMKEMIKKVRKLKLPTRLENVLTCIVEGVGRQILNWINYHIIVRHYVSDLPNEFFWTILGTADNKKLAEILVNDERLHYCERFQLACLYCLEENIVFLWRECRDCICVYQFHEPLVLFWLYYLEGEIYQLHDNLMSVRERAEGFSHLQLAFRLSVISGNEAGTRYFLHLLTPEERSKSLLVVATNTYSKHNFYNYNYESFSQCHYTNNLCFLLSEMDANQQAELFRCEATGVLLWFLNWQWHDLFISIAREIWKFLQPEDYCTLLQAIMDKITETKNNFIYKKIFMKFWHQGSISYKRHAINNCSKSVLSAIIEIEDEENFRLIHEVTNKSKLSDIIKTGNKEDIRMIFEKALRWDREESILHDLIIFNKWDILKFLFQECIKSKEALHKLEKRLENYIIRYLSGYITFKEGSELWNKFYGLFNDIKQEKKNEEPEENMAGVE